MNKFFLYSFILLLTSLSQVKGQSVTTDTKGTLTTEQVSVVKDYEPSISNAIRISESPIIQEANIEKQKINYPLITKQYKTSFNVEPIAHATIKGEPLLKLNNHYIKLGFGNYNTPFGEYYFNSTRDKKYNYYVKAKHFSSTASMDKAFYPGISENAIEGAGTYLFQNYTLTGNLDITRNVVHFYGHKEGIDTMPYYDSLRISKDIFYQRFANVGFNAKLESKFTDSAAINYVGNLKYYTYFDNLGASETHFNTNGDLGKYMNGEWMGANVGLQYFNNYNSILEKQDNVLVNVSPRAEMKRSKLKLKIGVQAFIDAGKTSYFRFYPDAEARYSILNTYLGLYAGITGKTYRNSYKDLSTVNPFVESTIELKNSYQKINLYAGLFGNFGSRMNYDAGVNYKQVENLPLFYNNYYSFLQNKFDVVYDTVKITNLYGELGYQIAEKLKIKAKANLYNYVTSNQEFAWHLPLYDATLNAAYSLKQKINIGLDLYYVGLRRARAFEYVNDSLGIQPMKVSMKDIIDFNLYTEYRYTKNISAFLRLNNMASMRYYRWNNYASQRFNFLMGFTYAF